MNRLVRTSRSTLIVCIAVSLAGCYTLFNHPSTDDGADEYERADFTRCSQCHENYYPVNPHEPIYSDLWWDYYSLPWWYDEIISISGEEETTVRQTIRETEFRDPNTPTGTSPVGVKRTPPGGEVKEKKGGGDVRESATDEKQTEKREKTATKAKRTGRREREAVRDTSGTDDTRDDEQEETGGEKRRDKKGKRQ